ncbi:GNAT family N-acetyltransferase [Christiangramia sp. SM2212]|uniref:GNAT family N-acetyltransferase n=1 Tax=Christiangramia sediminicola TaxID=3073267 RepID=A0ABU1EQA1_9FLAO|nr:GNAT family N-acetyltransferase [Christiangramia sp. SM2212]MDR5590569.1 GNAT family N-acetyltransferase [Christiangramia sp. SM2212]
MIIREATVNDIAEILFVLKRSLGETSSKKTEDVWRYKHIDNPFGRSLVLVAEEKNKIVGVRAFMRWKWQRENQIYNSYRAVDTATDPSHQGKGIFKKLTLKALEIAKEEGGEFIFNTPNEQSKPGYLKMGWQEVGRLNVALRPVLNIGTSNNQHCHIIKNNLGLDVIEKYKGCKMDSNKIFTPKNRDYINWRYKKCRLQNYWIFEDSNVFLACYPKKRKFITELRVSEAIFTNSIGRKTLNKKLLEINKKIGANLISDSTGLLRYKLVGNFGPDFTIRNLNNQNLDNTFMLEYWDYSLGDLELF